MSFADHLAAASRPERLVSVCLRGDLVAEVQHLEEQMSKARADAQTLADRGDVRDIAARIEELRAVMLDGTSEFRLRGVNNRTWSRLVVEHPVRSGNAQDSQLGYNSDTFFAALVRECLVEPELSDDDYERLLDVLSFGQYDELVAAALAVSRYRVDVPFSPAASEMLRSYGESSEQHEG